MIGIVYFSDFSAQGKESMVRSGFNLAA